MRICLCLWNCFRFLDLFLLSCFSTAHCKSQIINGLSWVSTHDHVVHIIQISPHLYNHNFLVHPGVVILSDTLWNYGQFKGNLKRMDNGNKVKAQIFHEITLIPSGCQLLCFSSFKIKRSLVDKR